jgi:enoyl-CoA hydratase/carnithine racemase
MTLTYAVRDRIAYISFCRPEKHNALRDVDLADLTQVVHAFDADDAADIGIIFGEGRSFSSGSDVGMRMQRAFEDGGAYTGPDESEAFFPVTNWKPVIAAVHGYCMGQAINVAFLCDLVVAARTARFQVTEALIGVPTASFVDRLGGGPLAIRAGLTGAFFTGEEAAAAGLLAVLAEDGEHLSAAEDLARTILANPQPGVRELVRVRRTLAAERAARTSEIAGQFDWANDPSAQERILARISRHAAAPATTATLTTPHPPARGAAPEGTVGP